MPEKVITVKSGDNLQSYNSATTIQVMCLELSWNFNKLYINKEICNKVLRERRRDRQRKTDRKTDRGRRDREGGGAQRERVISVTLKSGCSEGYFTCISRLTHWYHLSVYPSICPFACLSICQLSVICHT